MSTRDVFDAPDALAEESRPTSAPSQKSARFTPPALEAYCITDFCRLHGISRSLSTNFVRPERAHRSKRRAGAG